MELGHLEIGGWLSTLRSKSVSCEYSEVLPAPLSNRGDTVQCWEIGGIRILYGVLLTYIDFHLLVQAIIHNQTVGHPNPVRLHRMPRDIGIITHV